MWRTWEQRCRDLYAALSVVSFCPRRPWLRAVRGPSSLSVHLGIQGAGWCVFPIGSLCDISCWDCSLTFTSSGHPGFGVPHQDPGELLAGAPAVGVLLVPAGSRQCLGDFSVNGLCFLEQFWVARTEFPHTLFPVALSWPLA